MKSPESLDDASAPPGETFAQVDGLLGAVRRLRKHWAPLLASVLIALVLSVLYLHTAQRAYRATTLLEINPHLAQPMGDSASQVLDMGAGIMWDTREYYETQYKIIVSTRVLSTVVRDLALTSDRDFLGPLPRGEQSASVEDAAAILRGRVTVDPVKDSRLARISVEDTDPGRAKRICDGVATAYLAQNLDTALASTSDAVVWLNGQLDHVKQDLEVDEDRLHEFKQNNNLPSTSINEASNMLRVEMQELDTSLTHTRTRRAELEARHAELAKVSQDNPDELPASELLSSPFLQTLRTQYQDALRERNAQLAEGKGENHPSVKRASERMADARGALLREIGNIKGAVERDLSIVRREEDTVSGLFEASRGRAVELNMKEIEYHRLDRSREQDEKLYGLLLQRMKESDLARMMRVNNIRVVDVAEEPRVPVRPRATVAVSVGLLLGLLFGLGVAWIREQLDTSLKTPTDLERELRVTFLGLLPELSQDDDRHPSESRKARRHRAQLGEEAPELVVHTRPLSGIAEAARSVRTNLMFMNPDQPYRKLLISSAAPSEGKTTVACSIAIAFAQGGQRVCIVDCDLRRPRLHRIFGRAGDAGVTNVIVGESTVDEVAKPTAVRNLWAIPAGPIPPNPADMLHSDRFKKFIADLGERFDRVIVDSPPVVAVTDSAILSTLVDGTVFVVRAFKTSRHLSAQGLRSLRDVDARVVGAVLNAVNLNRHEYSYYYHYYYYKRNGYRATPVAAIDEAEDAGSSPPN
jgi:capsular exopolysaccharide synthesis family protein